MASQAAVARRYSDAHPTPEADVPASALLPAQLAAHARLLLPLCDLACLGGGAGLFVGGSTALATLVIAVGLGLRTLLQPARLAVLVRSAVAGLLLAAFASRQRSLGLLDVHVTTQVLLVLMVAVLSALLAEHGPAPKGRPFGAGITTVAEIPWIDRGKGGFERALSQTGQHRFAVMAVGIDGYDLIDRLWGPRVANEAAQRVERAIRAWAGTRTPTTRVERDEFAILLVNASPSAVRGAADRLAHAIAQDPAIEVTPSISTGWAAGGGAFAEGGGAKEAWAEARQALWVARELGGGEVLGAGAQRTPQADARDRLLARVVGAHTLTVVHEGVVDLASGRMIAIEAVARPAWMPTNQGIAELFTAAREMGALAMLEHTARAALIEASSALPDRLPLHINVSLSGVPGAAAADAVELAAQLRGIGREPHSVVLDLTDAAECPLPIVAEAATAYRVQGFQLSIEGIRGAALATQVVETVAPALLKLDHGTLRRTVISASARAEIAQLVSRAHALGTLVVGTAIDTPGMAEQAVALGITAGQGRHFESEQLPLSA